MVMWKRKWGVLTSLEHSPPWNVRLLGAFAYLDHPPPRAPCLLGNVHPSKPSPHLSPWSLIIYKGPHTKRSKRGLKNFLTWHHVLPNSGPSWCHSSGIGTHVYMQWLTQPPQLWPDQHFFSFSLKNLETLWEKILKRCGIYVIKTDSRTWRLALLVWCNARMVSITWNENKHTISIPIYLGLFTSDLD